MREGSRQMERSAVQCGARCAERWQAARTNCMPISYMPVNCMVQPATCQAALTLGVVPHVLLCRPHLHSAPEGIARQSMGGMSKPVTVWIDAWDAHTSQACQAGGASSPASSSSGRTHLCQQVRHLLLVGMVAVCLQVRLHPVTGIGRR